MMPSGIPDESQTVRDFSTLNFGIFWQMIDQPAPVHTPVLPGSHSCQPRHIPQVIRVLAQADRHSVSRDEGQRQAEHVQPQGSPIAPANFTAAMELVGNGVEAVPDHRQVEDRLHELPGRIRVAQRVVERVGVGRLRCRATPPFGGA